MHLPRIRLASGLLLGAALLASEASAQTCPAPTALAINQSTWIDTCFADTSLVVVCQMFELSGPAGVARVILPYPVGRISVQSMTGGYDPVLFLLRSQCNNSSSCGMAVDSGFVIDTLELREVDSGDYYLAIAPMAGFSQSVPCGQVLVTYSMTAAEQALTLDGVFRGGISAPSSNP